LGPTDDVALVADELGDRSDDLMLVGHLPYVDRMASHLVAGDADLEAFDFAAAGAMCLTREEGSGQAAWVVRWLIDPSLLMER
ncbi:MAG: phosphohistidine phosphatase SixA, partial [Actinobacteria bacterium]|nr:phosphohistidine phosphatase SixA [Actinomycetota bacterium]